MQNSSQLETCANELVTAISTLSSYSRRAEVMQGPGSQPKSNPEDPREIEQARSCILSTIGRIRMLICEPTELLEHLTSQV